MRLTILSIVILSAFFYVAGKSDHGIYGFKSQSAGHFEASGDSLPGQADPEPASDILEERQEALLAPSSSTVDRPPSRQDFTADTGGADMPDTPVRNPRRVKPRVAEGPGVAALPEVEKPTQKSSPQLVADTSKTPLFPSYHQRFATSKANVLGPRLTTVLMKRELRRLGCYNGNITGKWDKEMRTAVELFNSDGGFDLATDRPHTRSFEKLKQAVDIVCVKRPDASDRAIIAGTAAGGLIAASKGKTGNRWRSTAERKNLKAAYRPQTSNQNPTVAGNRDDEEQVAPKPAQAVRKVAKRKKAKRKTAVRAWKKRHRRKKFGFRMDGGSFSLE